MSRLNLAGEPRDPEVDVRYEIRRLDLDGA